jgi:hypothetical protein
MNLSRSRGVLAAIVLAIGLLIAGCASGSSPIPSLIRRAGRAPRRECRWPRRVASHRGQRRGRRPMRQFGKLRAWRFDAQPPVRADRPSERWRSPAVRVRVGLARGAASARAWRPNWAMADVVWTAARYDVRARGFLGGYTRPSK